MNELKRIRGDTTTNGPNGTLVQVMGLRTDVFQSIERKLLVAARELEPAHFGKLDEPKKVAAAQRAAAALDAYASG